MFIFLVLGDIQGMLVCFLSQEDAIDTVETVIMLLKTYYHGNVFFSIEGMKTYCANLFHKYRILIITARLVRIKRYKIWLVFIKIHILYSFIWSIITPIKLDLIYHFLRISRCCYFDFIDNLNSSTWHPHSIGNFFRGSRLYKIEAFYAFLSFGLSKNCISFHE